MLILYEKKSSYLHYFWHHINYINFVLSKICTRIVLSQLNVFSTLSPLSVYIDIQINVHIFQDKK